MISIVCVYNNKEILENYLLKNLSTKSVEYELILIDNTNGKFKSAAEAINYGGKKAKGNYLMFVHQDVNLSSPSWLMDVESILKNLDNLGVAGVAGSIGETEIISNIKDGIPPQTSRKQKINKPQKSSNS